MWSNKCTMKTLYLQAMGITNWRLRDAPRYYLLTGSARRHGVLVATVNAGQAEPDLLAAIIKALGVEAKEIQTPVAAAPSIALGPQPATINTHSLAEMLRNPTLKAPVWQALQKFVKSL